MTDLDKAKEVVRKWYQKEQEFFIKFNVRLGYPKLDSIPDKLIFHGGCLSCGTPQVKGLHSCYDCTYLNWDSKSCTDLSDDYILVEKDYLLRPSRDSIKPNVINQIF